MWLAGGFAFAALAIYSFGKFDGSYIGSIQTAKFLNGAAALAGIAVTLFAVSTFAAGDRINQERFTQLAIGISAFTGIITVMTAGASNAGKTAAGAAVMCCYVYGLFLLGALLASEVDGN